MKMTPNVATNSSIVSPLLMTPIKAFTWCSRYRIDLALPAVAGLPSTRFIDDCHHYHPRPGLTLSPRKSVKLVPIKSLAPGRGTWCGAFSPHRVTTRSGDFIDDKVSPGGGRHKGRGSCGSESETLGQLILTNIKDRNREHRDPRFFNCW